MLLRHLAAISAKGSGLPVLTSRDTAKEKENDEEFSDEIEILHIYRFMLIIRCHLLTVDVCIMKKRNRKGLFNFA